MTSVSASRLDSHLAGIARGGALGLFGSVVAGASGFALVALAARGLPTADAGKFFVVTAVFILLQGMCAIGTDTGMARFLLRHEANGRADLLLATVRGALVASTGLALIVSACGIVWAGPLVSWLGGSDADALRVMLFALPAGVLADGCFATARALTEIRSTALFDRLLRAGSQPLLVLAALTLGGGLLEVTAAWAASHVLGAVAGTVVLRRVLQRRNAGRISDAGWGTAPLWREFWAFASLRGVARLAQIGMQRADIILVAALVSPTGAAAYTVATRFVPLGQLSTQAVQQVLQPRVTQILVHDDRETLTGVYRVATAWNMVLAWPLYVGVMALGEPYLAIFGDAADTAQAGAVVMIMATAMLLAVASGPVDTLLLMSGRSMASAGNACLALAVDVGLCLLLLPWWGIAGAAVAWAAAVLTRCGLAFYQIGRSMGVHPVGRQTVTAAGVALVGVAMPCWLLSWLDVRGWWLLVGLVGVGCGYLAVLRAAAARLALDQAWSALRVRDGEAWR